MKKFIVSIIIIYLIIFTGCEIKAPIDENNRIVDGNNAVVDEENSSVEELEPSVKVKVFWSNTAVITKDGELWVWGSNDAMQLADDSFIGTNIPKKILDDVVDVIIGTVTLAIKNNGELWTWGLNDEGQLGDGTMLDRSTPQKILDDVMLVKQGERFAMALKKNGELWSWGNNDIGQLGDGTFQNKNSPIKIMEDVKYFDTLMYTTYAVKTNGELWTWGKNSAEKETNELSVLIDEYPRKIMDDVNKVIAGFYDVTYAIKDNGELWGWGGNYHSELGLNGTVHGPIKILDGVKDAKINDFNCVVLKENGELWIWDKSGIENPQKVLDDVRSIYDAAYPLVLKENGELWRCAITILDDSGNTEIIASKLMDNIVSATGTEEYEIAATTDNKVIIWENFDSEIGDYIWESEKIKPLEVIFDKKTPAPY